MKKLIIFGTGAVAENMTVRLNADRIYCFADNNKAGQMFHGKPVISFDELLKIHTDYDIIIGVGSALYPELDEQLRSFGIKHRAMSYIDYSSNPEIAQFKGAYNGQRCFLIGNGPSLRADDLTTLYERGELCFGCNAISKIFTQTPWRPNFFVVTDTIFLLEYEMLVNTEADYKFFPMRFFERKDATGNKILGEGENGDDASVFFNTIYAVGEGEAFFSPDSSRAIYSGATVMYTMIQLAVYMGFAKIYLLGVDGGTHTENDPVDYLSKKRHFYDDDENLVRSRGKLFFRLSAEESATRVKTVYTRAEEYTREHGQKIFNATRGGQLDIFERVNLDTLFEK